MYHIRYADIPCLMLPVVQKWSTACWIIININAARLQHSCNLRSQTQTLPASWHWRHVTHCEDMSHSVAWIYMAHFVHLRTGLHTNCSSKSNVLLLCAWLQNSNVHTKFASFWASWLGSLLSDFDLLGSRFHLKMRLKLFKTQQLIVEHPPVPTHEKT